MEPSLEAPGLGSLSACLLPANSEDLPVLCRACCPPPVLTGSCISCPSSSPPTPRAAPLGDGVWAQAGWAALRALLNPLAGSGRALRPVMGAPASINTFTQVNSLH